MMLCPHTHHYMLAFVHSLLSISDMKDISLWTLQTSSPFPCQSQPPTYLPLSFSWFFCLTLLLCILDETTKLRFFPSISHPAIMHVITHSLLSWSFFLLPQACNYRPCHKTQEWICALPQSLVRLLLHLFLQWTQLQTLTVAPLSRPHLYTLKTI